MIKHDAFDMIFKLGDKVLNGSIFNETVKNCVLNVRQALLCFYEEKGIR